MDFNKKLMAFISGLQKKLAELESAKNSAFFEASITGSEESFRNFESLELEYTTVLGQPDSLEFLSNAVQNNNINDPVLERQLTILYLMHVPHQIPDKMRREIISLETRIEQQFTSFRAEVNNRNLTDNQVESILETSTDNSEVKEVWEASKQSGKLVEKDLLKLVALRNETARQLGYRNYYQMSLQVSEQNPNQILALFDELDELTGKAFEKVKAEIDKFLSEKFNIAGSALRPWHYQDRFFQEMPKIYNADLDKFYQSKDLAALTYEYFNSIGMDIGELLQKSDLYEKPGKNQHAYCININRSNDIRVLCNVKPDHKWMSTMLHEFGHAVYEKYYQQQLPFFLREPAHIFTTEAVAMFFGRLSANPSWMHKMSLIDKDQALELSNVMNKMQTLAQLVFSRWVQVMVRFEMALYENPEQDLNALWWTLVTKYQGVNPPEETDFPHWASKIHLATAPCYYHNYMLGELLASQFHFRLTQKQPKEKTDHLPPSFHGEQEIGDFFKNKVFARGASLKWDKLIQEATGESLNPRYYARQFINPAYS